MNIYGRQSYQLLMMGEYVTMLAFLHAEAGGTQLGNYAKLWMRQEIDYGRFNYFKKCNLNFDIIIYFHY